MDQPVLRPGTGGLVTALSPIMERTGGIWVGWTGSRENAEEDAAWGSAGEQLISDFKNRHAFDLKPVHLTREEIDGYYHGFSNETLWPLFHNFLGRSHFDAEAWQVYVNTNRKFAEAVAAVAGPEDLIWVHDYHLLLMGEELRRLGVRNRIGFFLHIPFPSSDLFRCLPWRLNILKALLHYDLIGFQVKRDHRNFVDCVRSFEAATVLDFKRRTTRLQVTHRSVIVGDFPISIDFEEFNQAAQSRDVEEAAAQFHASFTARCIVLGVDRLDYTKGIPERFRAFARALEKYPQLRGNISLYQLLVPSRTDIPEYQRLKEELDKLVGRINGEYSIPGWVPIHYSFRTLSRTELLGCYRASDIALITPSRDGMNLVAKEYCASQIERRGVLILSEFAGAAKQLAAGAVLINPYDLEATADAIYRAYKMEESERAHRMRVMQRNVRRNDVHRWVEQFMDSLNSSPEMASLESAPQPSRI